MKKSCLLSQLEREDISSKSTSYNNLRRCRARICGATFIKTTRYEKLKNGFSRTNEGSLCLDRALETNQLLSNQEQVRALWRMCEIVRATV